MLLLSAVGCGAQQSGAQESGAHQSASQNKGKAGVADVQIITHGDKVDLAAHLAAGKYTVIDFYAAWCPPCRMLGPAIERLAAKENQRLAVRKVDVVDWTMPVVDQYAIEALPHLMLYGPDGQRVADGDAVYAELVKIFGDSAHEVHEVGSSIGVEDAPGTPATDAAGQQHL
jgi:thiol-disulfide isomerase/thioredoxin